MRVCQYQLLGRQASLRYKEWFRSVWGKQSSLRHWAEKQILLYRSHTWTIYSINGICVPRIIDIRNSAELPAPVNVIRNTRCQRRAVKREWRWDSPDLFITRGLCRQQSIVTFSAIDDVRQKRHWLQPTKVNKMSRYLHNSPLCNLVGSRESLGVIF